MAKKTQLPVIGGVRKVIIPGSNIAVGTTIEEFGSHTVTLAQLAAALKLFDQPSSGLIGTGDEASIQVGPGLSGGGPLLGNVRINLTAPVGAHLQFEEGAGVEDQLNIPGPKGDRGPVGLTVPIYPDDVDDVPVIPGPPGAQGQQGVQGATIYPEDPDDPVSIPGPAGAPGVAGVSGTSGYPLTPEDPEDVLMIPGPPGNIGLPGNTGPGGLPGATLVPDDPEDPIIVPGPPGNPGSTGPAGARGLPITVYPEDPDDVQTIPGPTGLTGATGLQGATGFPLPADDGEDALPIPGPPGTTGAIGPRGYSIVVWPEDPDDALTIPGVPGPVGQTGAQGPGGGGGAGVGWAAYLDYDYPEESPIFGDTGMFVRKSGDTMFSQLTLVGTASLAVIGTGGIGVYGPAATQVGAYFWGQAGQSTWELYMAPSSNDTHIYNNGYGDVMVWTGTGRVNIGQPSAADAKFCVYETIGGAGFRVGYNNTSVNYYDADLHYFRSGAGTSNQQYLKLDPTNGVSLYNFNNAAYGSGATQVAGLQITNASATAQTVFEVWVPNSSLGAALGRVRFDYAGGMSYVAKGSLSAHVFWLGGDSGVGAIACKIEYNGGLPSVEYELWRNQALNAYVQMYTQSAQAYGTLTLGGGGGGYVGIKLIDLSFGATFMSATGSNTAGVYLQNVSRWAFYDNNINFYIQKPILCIGGSIIVGDGTVPPTTSTNQIAYSGLVQTTASAGTGGAPPVAVAGYIVINVAGTQRKIPFYAN